MLFLVFSMCFQRVFLSFIEFYLNYYVIEALDSPSTRVLVPSCYVVKMTVFNTLCSPVVSVLLDVYKQTHY